MAGLGLAGRGLAGHGKARQLNTNMEDQMDFKTWVLRMQRGVPCLNALEVQDASQE